MKYLIIIIASLIVSCNSTRKITNSDTKSLDSLKVKIDSDKIKSDKIKENAKSDGSYTEENGGIKVSFFNDTSSNKDSKRITVSVSTDSSGTKTIAIDPGSKKIKSIDIANNKVKTQEHKERSINTESNTKLHTIIDSSHTISSDKKITKDITKKKTPWVAICGIIATILGMIILYLKLK